MTFRATDPDLDETSLVDLARSGDSQALTRLVERHQGMVFRYLTGMLKDEELAADVAQDTFVKAIRNLNGFRGEAALRTWLLAIARNEARGALRKMRYSRESSIDEVAEPMDEGPTPAQAMESETEMMRIRRGLERLPEKQRLSVSLRLFDGLSFREVGDATESTEGTARVNYHHGIRKLREWLDPRGG